MFTHTKIC